MRCGESTPMILSCSSSGLVQPVSSPAPLLGTQQASREFSETSDDSRLIIRFKCKVSKRRAALDWSAVR
ncbi:hypothetical protein GJAV_G00171850 [Gymnothorax javanicus]|nr:hypothetical protein GJAV_G00171850 [Gymnothorax javanicus]